MRRSAPSRWLAGAIVGLAWMAGVAVCAAAQDEGAPDSLDVFLRSLSDSTDVYFGPSSAAVDTAGLDSALTSALKQPWLKRRRESWRLEFGPWLGFDRVDGPAWGGSVGLGRSRHLGRLNGRAAYAAGPNEWRGGGSWVRRWGGERDEDPVWELGVTAGRFTEVMDPDLRALGLRLVYALVNGSDYQHYLQRDGAVLHLGREAPDWRVRAGFRTQLESALTTTTTWNLFDQVPRVIGNLPATRGRVRALELDVATRLPHVPLKLGLEGRWASDRLDSDFDYRRFRAQLAGDFRLGDLVALVPDLEYGRLAGDAIPQASFFLGGNQTLRSFHPHSSTGTGRTTARLDAIFTPDLLALARIPHPAFMPIQGAIFTGSGAVWGRDPFGGPGSAENGWPEPEAWRSEVGASILYRPGIPDPAGFIRLDYARAIGPGDAERWWIYYSTPLDIVRFGD